MLHDIVLSAFSGQPDMEIVDRVEGELVAVIRARQPDVVVVAEAWAGAHLLHGRLLGASSRLCLLTLTDDGNHAGLVQIGQASLGEVSPRGLVDAVRAALGSEPPSRAEGRRRRPGQAIQDGPDTDEED
jgi:hypothetical protein